MLRKARKERPESAEEVRRYLARAAVEFHEQATRAKLPMTTVETRLDDLARKAPTVIIEAQTPIAGQVETRLEDTARVAPTIRADSPTPLTGQLENRPEDAARKAPPVLAEAQTPIAGQPENRLQETPREVPTVVTSAHVPVVGQHRRLDGRLRMVGVTAAVLAVGIAALAWAVWGEHEPADVKVEPSAPRRTVEAPDPTLAQVAAAKPVEPAVPAPTAAVKIVEPPTPAPLASATPIVPRAVEPRPTPRPLAPTAKPVRAPPARLAPSPRAQLLDDVDDNLDWVRAQQNAGRFDDPLALRLLGAVKEEATQARDGAAVERAAAMLRDWKARYRSGSRPSERGTKAR